MPNVDDLKQSRFLTQRDVDPPVLVTIKSYEQMNVARQTAEPDMRYILYFQELDKPMTLNSTNGQLIRAITGSNPLADDEFDEWIGKKIVLYREPNVSFGGEVTGGIRCRAIRHQAQPDAPEPTKEVAKPQTAQGGRPNPDYDPDYVPPNDDVPF